MKIAYFDCFSGVSGDMCLGALVAAGVDFEQLKEELARLPVEGYALRREKIKRSGITATNIFVDLLELNQPERRLADIRQIIDGSSLPEPVKEKSKAVFNRLAVAEATVHDTSPDRIHFHEVGAVDAIVDVVGTVLGLHLLGVEKVYASPLPMGKGFIRCMHGIIPSPAPATLEILQDVPIYGAGIQGELVTPTGAALMAVLADAFVDLPALTVTAVGYGSGKKSMDHPNLLRLIVGELYKSGVAGPIPCHGGHHGHDQHRHGHPHDHEHAVHAHSHGHSHGHIHHSHHHEHKHEHRHGAGGHEPEHDHDHTHDHDHSHEPGQENGHEHGHGHCHGKHLHGHHGEHGCVHGHDHHGHSHGEPGHHGHDHGEDRKPKEEDS